jgi:hypothetical protein
MIEVHLKKLRARDDISAVEEREIRALVRRSSRSRPTGRSSDTGSSSTSPPCCSTAGWRAQRTCPAVSGNWPSHVAGDFADLHSFTLKRLDHDIITLTPCRVASVPHERLQDLTQRYPHLARLYWFMTNLDAAIHREWTLSLGRRTALSRMAHFFSELNVRLSLVGLRRTTAISFR